MMSKSARMWLGLGLALASTGAAAQTGTVPLDAGTPPSGLTNSSITESNGNVGIGTTSPQSTLDVNGNINYGTLKAGIGVYTGGYVGSGYYYVGSLPNIGVDVVQHLYVEVLGGSWWSQGLTRWVCNAYNGAVKCTRLNDSYSPDVNDIVAYLDSNNNYDFYVSTNAGNGWSSFAVSAKLFDGTNYRTVNVVSVPSPSGVQQPIALTVGPSLVPGGNVGIGTTTPSASLEVVGSIKIDGGVGSGAIGTNTAITFPDGTFQGTAWRGVLSGADYAESVDVTGDRKKYEPGDVLVIDPGAERTFLKSSAPYSTHVMGVYSTKPGVLGRPATADEAKLKEQVPMAMVGIVPTKVSAENGPIEPGDMLVTASMPGYAMKGTDRSQMFGAVIGKALGHLDSGTGLIEVAVSLQ
jgi:hypothetical protein